MEPGGGSSIPGGGGGIPNIGGGLKKKQYLKFYLIKMINLPVQEVEVVG
jgi:hypothetical protein